MCNQLFHLYQGKAHSCKKHLCMSVVDDSEGTSIVYCFWNPQINANKDRVDGGGG